MARNPALVIALLLATLAAAVPALAQSETLPEQPWSRGTTLGVFGGAANTSDTQGAIGGTLGWEINRWFEIEGVGTWVVPRHGDKAFAAEFRLLTNLTRANVVTPFVAAGAGLYLATFDSAAGLPPFYQNRLASSPDNGQISFTDPSLVFAAGVDIYCARHLSLKPEVSVRVVMSGSDTYNVPMFTLRATYHFERHELPR